MLLQTPFSKKKEVVIYWPTWNRFVCAGSRRISPGDVLTFFFFFATTLLVSQDLDRLFFCPMYPKTDVRRLQKKGGAGIVLTFFLRHHYWCR